MFCPQTDRPPHSWQKNLLQEVFLKASAEPLKAKLKEAEIKRENEEERLWFAAVTALRQYEETKKTPPREGVEAIWRAIDHGGLLSDEDTAKWAKFVAEDVVKNVIDETKEPNRRPYRAAAALKIVGHAEKNIEEYEELKWLLFRSAVIRLKIKDPNTPIDERKELEKDPLFMRLSPTALAEVLLARGSFQGLSLPQAEGRTRRLLDTIYDEKKIRR